MDRKKIRKNLSNLDVGYWKDTSSSIDHHSATEWNECPIYKHRRSKNPSVYNCASSEGKY